MDSESIFFFKSFFGAAFLITLLAGVYLLKNYQKFFGVDPNMPTDNSSTRSYTATMIFTVWLHMLALFGGFAIWLR